MFHLCLWMLEGVSLSRMERILAQVGIRRCAFQYSLIKVSGFNLTPTSSHSTIYENEGADARSPLPLIFSGLHVQNVKVYFHKQLVTLYGSVICLCSLISKSLKSIKKYFLHTEQNTEEKELRGCTGKQYQLDSFMFQGTKKTKSEQITTTKKTQKNKNLT